MKIMILLVSISVFVFTVLLLRKFGKASDVKTRRFSDAVNKVKVEKYVDFEKSFYERFFQPILQSVVRKFSLFIPKNKRQDNKQLEKNLRYAGITLTVSEFSAIKTILVAIFLISSIAVALIVAKDNGIRLLIILCGVLLGFSSPIFIIRSKTQARRTSIQHQLPEVMDILMVSIEAGLGLDEAISQMSGRIEGPVVDEFQMVIREIQMGKPRKDAFERLADCADIQELKVFVSAVIQAEQLGIPIKNVLNVQSASMRELRKQVAQEKGMKAPVKMIIPMVLFILPVLFIVLLAPVVIQLIEQFG